VVNVDLGRRTGEFTYTTGAVALGIGATVPVAIDVTADALFVCTKRSQTTLDTNDAVIAAPEGPNNAADRILVSCRLSDSNKSVVDENNPIPLSSFAGTGQLPYILPTPLPIEPSSKIFVTLTNLSGAIRRVRLSFHGIKLYSPELYDKGVLASIG